MLLHIAPSLPVRECARLFPMVPVCVCLSVAACGGPPAQSRARHHTLLWGLPCCDRIKENAALGRYPLLREHLNRNRPAGLKERLNDRTTSPSVLLSKRMNTKLNTKQPSNYKRFTNIFFQSERNREKLWHLQTETHAILCRLYLRHKLQ